MLGDLIYLAEYFIRNGSSVRVSTKLLLMRKTSYVIRRIGLSSPSYTVGLPKARTKTEPTKTRKGILVEAMPSPRHTLYAISDIHLSYPQNREYWSALPLRKHDFPEKSGLILAGDVGESISHLRLALEIALQVFPYVWWVPGNHELYTLPKTSSTSEPPTPDSEIDSLHGEARYHAFIKVCHEYPGVYTPEDEWLIWDSEAEAEADPVTKINQQHPPSPTGALICPLFTLYDYTFRPDHLRTAEEALAWAAEKDIVATDEALLHSNPYPNKQSWCSHLVTTFHTRLRTLRSQYPSLPFVLINHWPLREEVLYIPSIPRFSLWCGTRATRHWDSEFAPVAVVVSGHLHVRRTDWIDSRSNSGGSVGVSASEGRNYNEGNVSVSASGGASGGSGSINTTTRWEEVSLGYPRQWTKIREQELDVAEVLREILPGLAAEEARAMGRGEVAGALDAKGRVEGQVTLYRTYGGR